MVRLFLLPLYFVFIAHKATLDYSIGLLITGIIFWHLATVFARRSLWQLAYCGLLLLVVRIGHFLLEGYLIYGSDLFAQREFRGAGALLRAVFLP